MLFPDCWNSTDRIFGVRIRHDRKRDGVTLIPEYHFSAKPYSIQPEWRPFVRRGRFRKLFPYSSSSGDVWVPLCKTFGKPFADRLKHAIAVLSDEIEDAVRRHVEFSESIRCSISYIDQAVAQCGLESPEVPKQLEAGISVFREESIRSASLDMFDEFVAGLKKVYDGENQNLLDNLTKYLLEVKEAIVLIEINRKVTAK